MHILIAPGAFKHSLSAVAVAQAIARGLEQSRLDCTTTLLPIADGGNDTLACFLMRGGQRIQVQTVDPLGRPITTDFGLLTDGQTAVVEMALASGLELLTAEERDPLRATTYGTGLLLKAALDSGASRVIIGMGGSATVDGGAGCLQAVGISLLKHNGKPIGPGNQGLAELDRIDPVGLDKRWRETEVIIASDVTNPTLGPNGAAAVFGPQKGATPEQVVILENNLRHFFEIVKRDMGIDVTETPGGGAAGALSAGLMAFLNGGIESGIDLLLDTSGFDALLAKATLVITGEGQIDSQTLDGKGPLGVARRAAAAGIPAVAIMGGLAVEETRLREAGIVGVMPIVTRPMPLADALANAAVLVERAALRLGDLLALGQKTPK